MSTTLKRTTTGCLFAAAILSLSVVAIAQPVGEGTGTAEDVTYSDQVDLSEYSTQRLNNARDNVSASVMVTLAYGITWLLTAGFLLMLWGKSRRVANEVSEARTRLAELDRQLARLTNRSDEEIE